MFLFTNAIQNMDFKFWSPNEALNWTSNYTENRSVETQFVLIISVQTEPCLNSVNELFKFWNFCKIDHLLVRIQTKKGTNKF